jgi:hypothetical protein
METSNLEEFERPKVHGSEPKMSDFAMGRGIGADRNV